RSPHQVHTAEFCTVPYNALHVTDLTRICTGALVPESPFHDSVSRLLASPRASGWSPDRGAALHYRAGDPVTRLLPLAAPPYRLPDTGPRTRPRRLQRVALYARDCRKSLSCRLQCHPDEPTDLWRHRAPDADSLQQRVESGLSRHRPGIGAGGWVGSYLAD